MKLGGVQVATESSVSVSSPLKQVTLFCPAGERIVSTGYSLYDNAPSAEVMSAGPANTGATAAQVVAKATAPSPAAGASPA